MMRTLLVPVLITAWALLPGSATAGDEASPRIAALSPTQEPLSPNAETAVYQGYFFDLTAIQTRKDYANLVEQLRHQVDNAEKVGLSQRVLNFFHTVPIVVDEFACLGTTSDVKGEADHSEPPIPAAACYTSALPGRLRNRPHWYWNEAEAQWSKVDPIDPDHANPGVVMARPDFFNPQRPTLLHELLHSYHAQVIPDGVKNEGIIYFYERGKSVYPAKSYLMRNEREFFAVTGSVFLNGVAYEPYDGKESFTRAKLKELQPDYYKYLVWLFAFDPDGAPHTSPVASIN
jgi:hypothetical protein